VSKASRGTSYELLDIKDYQAQGWLLLMRGVRQRYPDANNGICNDVFGAWDFVMYKDGCWMFVSVGAHGMRAQKVREALTWVMEKGVRLCEKIIYKVDLYQHPHWHGRGKKKVYFPHTTWERRVIV
jgi:hypothetical protein